MLNRIIALYALLVGAQHACAFPAQEYELRTTLCKAASLCSRDISYAQVSGASVHTNILKERLEYARVLEASPYSRPTKPPKSILVDPAQDALLRISPTSTEKLVFWGRAELPEDFSTRHPAVQIFEHIADDVRQNVELILAIREEVDLQQAILESLGPPPSAQQLIREDITRFLEQKGGEALKALKSKVLQASEEQLKMLSDAAENFTQDPRNTLTGDLRQRLEAEGLQVWHHQTTVIDVLLGDLFFPRALEEGTNSIFHLFDQEGVRLRLALSARHQNPVAYFYLEKMFRHFSPDDTHIFSTWAAEYRQRAGGLFRQAREECRTGRLAAFYNQSYEKKKATNFDRLISRMEDSTDLHTAALLVEDESTKKVLLKKAISKGHFPSELALAQLSAGSRKEAYETFLRGVEERGLVLGYYLAGITLLEGPIKGLTIENPAAIAIDFLTKAVRGGCYMAATDLGYVHERQARQALDQTEKKRLLDEQVRIYQEAGFKGYLRGFEAGAEILIRQGLHEKACSLLEKAGPLIGYFPAAKIAPQEEKQKDFRSLANHYFDSHFRALKDLSGV